MKPACKYAVSWCIITENLSSFQINGVNRLFFKKKKLLSPFDKSGILTLSKHNVHESLLYNFLHQLALVLCKFGKAVES